MLALGTDHPQPRRKRPIVAAARHPLPGFDRPARLPAVVGLALLMALAPPGTAAAESEPAPPESGTAAGKEADQAPPSDRSGGSQASGEESPATERKPRQRRPAPWYQRTMDVTHTTLSRTIEGTAKGIDSFFATEEALEEATRSYVRLQANVSWIESRGDQYLYDIDARLDLPGTEERLQLLVESDPEQPGADDDPLADTPAEAAEAESEDFSVALENWLEGGREVDWQLRSALGIRGGLPLNPFARLRVIRRDQYTKWDSRLSTTLAYFYQEGLIFNAAKDFDRPLSDTLLFRSRTAYQWKRQPDVESFQQTFSLFKTLTPRRRVAYEAGLKADDQAGWGLNEYFARIRYRQRVYKHWLFAELQPRVRWPKAVNYDHEAALLFRLEAVFGEKALRRSRRKE